jgi:hypothetical protein
MDTFSVPARREEPMRIPALAVVAGAALLAVAAPASSRSERPADATIFCGSETGRRRDRRPVQTMSDAWSC